MNRTQTVLFGGLFIFIIGGFIYQLKSENSFSPNMNKEQTIQSGTTESLSTQINEEGPVSVSVTPLFVGTSNPWEFELILQTHSVELDMDIAEVVVLIDQDGTEIKPLLWDGDDPKGHHRAGTVTFPAPDPIPETIIIQVKNIADIPLREFRW